MNTVKNTVMNTKMATSFPGSLSLILAIKSRIITQGRARCKFPSPSEACSKGISKIYVVLTRFYVFYHHFYFLSVLSIIDSFYKFQLQNDSKTLLIIYMLKGAIVDLQIIIIIAVLPKRFLEESWVLEFIGYL